jgi:hypothetical protein
MDLKFDWWFVAICDLGLVICWMLGLMIFLFVFGLIFLFSYFISRVFLELIETLFKWQPLMEERSKRRLVNFLAILISLAILASASFLEIRQSFWGYLMAGRELLSVIIQQCFH